jgi:L-serine dehydratase
VSIGKFIHELLGGCPEEANIVFYDSFAETYQGHGTDKALLGGLLGMDTDDSRIKQSLEWAKEHGMLYYLEFEARCVYFDHPNTTIVTVKRGDCIVKVGGVSLGGGLSKIFMIDGEMVDIRLSAGDDFAELANQYQLRRKLLTGVI